LLDQLEELFLAKGFARFTLDDLAVRLHCSKSTLYALADSKEQLALRVIRHFFRKATVAVEERTFTVKDPALRVTSYLTAVAAALAPAGSAFHRDLEASRHGGDTFAGYRAYWQADENFHRRIVEATDNEFLLRAYGSIEGHIQRFRLMVHNDMSGDHTVQEHQAIIDAFKAGDCAAATAAMNTHIEGIRSRSLSLAKFGQQG